jgi:hypothetical protein
VHRDFLNHPVFYDVMLRVLIETCVCLCYFIHWTNSEVLLVSTQEFPDDGTTGLPKRVVR